MSRSCCSPAAACAASGMRSQHRLRGGQHPIEFGRRGDGNLRHLLRQVRQPLVNPLDDRPLSARTSPGSFVATSTTRSTDGSRRNFSFLPRTSSGVSAIDSANHALRLVWLNSLMLEFDAFQPDRLEVQQIVVVAEVVHADGGDGRRAPPPPPASAADRRTADAARTAGSAARADSRCTPSAIGQPDHRRQDGRFGQPAEQDSAAGDQSQLRHAGKLGQPGREKGDGRGDRPGQDARPHRCRPFPPAPGWSTPCVSRSCR